MAIMPTSSPSQMNGSKSRCTIKGAGSGQSAYVLMGIRRRKASILPEHGGQAAPMVTQLGRKLTCLAMVLVSSVAVVLVSRLDWF
jgi:hypothetical protein